MAQELSGIHERLKARLKMRLVDLMDGSADGPRNPSRRAALEDQLRQTFKTLPEEFRSLRLSADDEQHLVQDVIDEVLGFGPLEGLLSDPSITEIMVNGPKEIFVERDGHLERIETTFHDTHHLMTIIERLLGGVGLSVTESDPVCDASLSDGTRINVIIPPLVLNGPVVTIRTKSRVWTMEDFVKIGAVRAEAAAFLQACVRTKVNMIIPGGTSVGKTTLVSILSNEIPRQERVITIENVAE